MPHDTAADQTIAVEQVLRDVAPQVLGALVRRSGDFGAAEDAVQDALLAAALQWPAEGLPDNPRGWLIQVAVRRLTDHQRREHARRRREGVALSQAPFDHTPAAGAVDTAIEAAALGTDQPVDPDDTLILLFMCGHPALTMASATALTLRAVGGLTTAEIAKAFLVPESTMAQRISRAKQTIKSSGVPFGLPGPAERDERLRLVMHVLYLIFNEGYTSSGGHTVHRVELSNEAIRLTRLLHASLPEHPEVTGLLALMLLTDARRAARAGTDGELIPLAEQDRRRWDRRAIEEGVALVSEALPRGAVGPYQLQAAIAALHDEAARVEETDWPQILALYELLAQLSDNPMVTLNHAIARAMVHGPASGLTMIAALDVERGGLRGHHRLHAVRAHLLEMAGERGAAIADYRVAAERTDSLPEQRYLLTRAAALSGHTP